MSDYIAKPLQPDTVRGALERIAPAGVPLEAESDAGAAAAAGAPFEASEVMSWFDHDVDAIVEVVGLLVRDLPAYVRNLADAATAGDLATVARVAHTIKGAVGNVAATAVPGIAEAIEDAAGGNHRARVVALCATLDAAARELIDGLQQWARGLPGSIPVVTRMPGGMVR
jgi:HPt (histidine-containing phosphotransfer) domain-containing protein